jgi:hypothetical protein
MNMGEEVVTFVRIPISEIEQIIRAKHSLPRAMIDVRLEPDSLILYFSDKERPNPSDVVSIASLPNTIPKKRRRRARRRRNRTKTRGWKIVERMTNKKGQACAIYKPFVEALSRPLPPADQRTAVMKILRSNGNRPSEATTSYFLENTLEYLSNKNS